MKKKILAVALATMMVVSSAVSAFAATSTVADLTVESFWGSHSEGIALEEGTTTITFKNTSNGSSNWENAIYAVYTANAAYAGTDSDGSINDLDGYTEYYVCRADVWGWDGAGVISAATLVTDTAPADEDAWAEWETACQGGVDATIAATLSGSTLTVVFTVGEAQSTATITVDSSVTTYITLTGEACVLSDISVTTPDSADETEADETEADETEADETEADEIEADETEADENTNTGDVATFASIAIVAAAAVAIVALRKRVTE